MSNGFKLTCGIAQSIERNVNGWKVLGSNYGGDEIPRSCLDRFSFSGQKSARDVALTKLTLLVLIST